MGFRFSTRTIVKLGVIAAVAAGAAVSIGALGASAQPVARASKSKKAYSTTVSYTSTTNGRQSGNSTVDIQGHGTFSAKLGSGAKLVAAIVSAATGVPVSKVAEGGTYKVRSADVSDGGNGVLVAHFKAHGLGTACLTYTAKGAPYNPSLGYVVASGTLKMVGGTGAAAHWRGSAKFTQDGIGGGSSNEQLRFRGSFNASTGSAHKPTAACKQVAAQSG
jgi:hypothetical protein